jgi:DNA-binding response OmpR family regulator
LSGEEAVEKVKGYNFDVVILDVAMPGMDGIATLRKIKNLKPLTEVLMLTGNATVESAVEGMKLGALDYVLKPCEIDDLVSKIKMGYDRKAEQEERIRSVKVSEIMASPMSALKE